MDIKWVALEKVLNEFADYFIQLARDNLQGNGSNATYGLYDSFEKVIEIDEEYYSVKISLEDYWVYVENGRSAGKFPPLPKIQEWINIKPIQPLPDINGKTPTIDQLTFLIGRKIAREGTEPQPFFEPAKEEALSKFELAIDLAIEEDIDNYVISQIDNYMLEKFKEL